MPLLRRRWRSTRITAQAVDIQRAGLKRQVRDIANGARNFAIGLRRRMNALDARNGEGGGGRHRRRNEQALKVRRGRHIRPLSAKPLRRRW
ncbi:MAG: hypothetical protein IPG83_17730 [Novosphingobium sp.]|nr:hypothetical protein [Novosphingobium sp.]